MSDAIGGYFQLEIKHGRNYHAEALQLNTARNCLEYVLRARGYKRIYLPYYTCDVMLKSLQKLCVECVYYTINEDLEPSELPVLQAEEAFLYTNYFGIKQDVVVRLAEHYDKRLIVDNAQAFYAPHIDGIDTFYSPRKFFGVADGAYLYTDCRLSETFSEDVSYMRMQHLLQRIDEGAEAGYGVFKSNEEDLYNKPILQMSKLTKALLTQVDYDAVRIVRMRNFEYLNEALEKKNKLKFKLSNTAVPMVYPYMTRDTALRDRLI